MSFPIDCLVPEWPAPATVKAAISLRRGGVSRAPYDSLNLGMNSGDDPEQVKQNRQRLRAHLALPGEPAWLAQSHSVRVVSANQVQAGDNGADAVYSLQPGQVCCVLTADCLPVLFCDKSGSRVAAAHAGWRGLAAGILETTVNALDCPAHTLLAWLGPAIGPYRFEVGTEVREIFIDHSLTADNAFIPSREGHYYCDLYALARLRLQALGVKNIDGGGLCTYTAGQDFYSYRRDKITGRMASLIWRQ